MKSLLELLADRMQILRNQEAFNDFVDDVMGTLRMRRGHERAPESDNVDELKQRIRGGKSSPQSQPVAIEAQAAAVDLPAHLKQALRDDEWLIRLKAVEQLASVEPKMALPYLVDIAREDSDCQVRVTAIEALAQLRDYPIVLDTLIEALDDEDYLVIDAAADRLKQRGAGAVYSVLRKLPTENVNTLAAVIEILGAIGNNIVVEQLIPYLGDTRRSWMGEKSIGDITAQALLTINTPQSIQAVHDSGYVAKPEVDAIIQPDSDAPHTATKKPLSRGEKVTLALRALRSDQWELSQKAARYLREYARRLRGVSDPAVVNPLFEALTDDNWVVRWTATEALAWLQLPETLPNLVKRFTDSSWIVRVAAVRALVELNAADYAPAVASLVQDENSAVREAAAEAIGVLKNRAVLPVLQQALQDRDDFVRLAAVQAITSLLDKEAAPLLISVLDDTYSHVRWTAIKHLAHHADIVDMQHFVQHLSDGEGPTWEEKTISDFAADGLRRINSPASLAALERWLHSRQFQSNEKSR